MELDKNAKKMTRKDKKGQKMIKMTKWKMTKWQNDKMKNEKMTKKWQKWQNDKNDKMTKNNDKKWQKFFFQNKKDCPKKNFTKNPIKNSSKTQ